MRLLNMLKFNVRIFPKRGLVSRAALASVLIMSQPFTLSASEIQDPRLGLEMMTTPNEAAGTRAIEAGHFEKGIAEALAALPAQNGKSQAALYANLCIGYLKTSNFEAAEGYCQKGVQSGWYDWVGYVNRGTLLHMQGNYAASLADFARALKIKPFDRVVRKNLNTAQIMFRELGGQNQQLVFN